MHKGLEAATLNTALLTQLTLKPSSVDRFRRGEILDDYSLDWILESLVQALGPRILMPGVEAHTQALSRLLATSAVTLANTPFVFGVLHADLLRTLAGKKGKDLEPGTKVHSEGCSSLTNLKPGDSEDPEDALRRFLCAVVGAEEVDAALRGSLDLFDGKGILVVTTWRLHTKVVVLACSQVPGYDSVWKWTISSLDSSAPGKI